MKKYFSFAAFALLALVGTTAFVACGSDDDDSKNNEAVEAWAADVKASLAGTWEIDAPDDEDVSREVFIFDNSGRLVIKDYKGRTLSETINQTFKVEPVNNNLSGKQGRLIMSGEQVAFALDGDNKLTLTDDDGDKQTANRIDRENYISNKFVTESREVAYLTQFHNTTITDNAGHVTSIDGVSLKDDGTWASETDTYTLTFNDKGLLDKVVHVSSAGTESYTFTYDSSMRLKRENWDQASGSSYASEFTWDDGNMTKIKDNYTTNYTYGSQVNPLRMWTYFTLGNGTNFLRGLWLLGYMGQGSERVVTFYDSNNYSVRLNDNGTVRSEETSGRATIVYSWR